MNNINYIAVVNLSDEEKRKIYSKCTKEELIDMLIQCNKIIDAIEPKLYTINDNNE